MTKRTTPFSPEVRERAVRMVFDRGGEHTRNMGRSARSQPRSAARVRRCATGFAKPTRSAQSVATPGAPLVNDIQLKDTGIILSVTPRLNAGGLVQLDISQEVSDVMQTTSSSIDSPTIRQRSVNSSVAVQSGTEIVLGGLISRGDESGHVGIPLLKDIPVVGEALPQIYSSKKFAMNCLFLQELLSCPTETMLTRRHKR